MRGAIVTVLLASLALGAQEGGKAKAPRAIAVKPAAAAGAVEHRIALVIGNGAYKDAPLKNPPADARAMAGALRTCGFQVDLVLDADRTRLFKAVREFGQRLGAGGVGLFYYAGHGMSVHGVNYLIPVATDISGEDEVEVQAISVQAVLNKMESAKNRLNLVILDACRNNPFLRESRSGTRGLSQMDAPTGSFIAYATAPGATASDGDGANGLYTRYLLKALREPGLKVEEVFKEVRVGVKKDSLDQQVPWDSSSLTGDFYFRPVAGAAEGAPAQDPAAEAAYAKGLAAFFGRKAPKDYHEALVRFIEAADLDHAEAQARLGWMYRMGVGTPVNQAKAGEYYRKAAEKGSARGLEGLATMYLGELPGSGVARDEAKAFEAMEASAGKDYVPALLGLGDLYARGAGTAKDEGRALVLYRKAMTAARALADQGDPEGQNNVGAIYNMGKGVPVDHGAALEWLRKAADQGFGPALINLAAMYFNGVGVAKNDTEAAAWYRKAAEQGLNQGYFGYGWMCEYGRGVPQSDAEAAVWYRKAALLGHVPAQKALAVLCAKGRGVPQNEAEAFGWYRRAADAGDAESQANVGYLFDLGKGVAVNKAEAAAWYRKAADQGNAVAQSNLGGLYLRGEGVAQSDKDALPWVRKAAERGVPAAQCNLGMMYQYGRALPKDLAQAEAWYRKAADQGNEPAKKALASMGK